MNLQCSPMPLEGKLCFGRHILGLIRVYYKKCCWPNRFHHVYVIYAIIIFLFLKNVRIINKTISPKPKSEIKCFTTCRWEATASEQLPEYMKGIYFTIFNFSNEVAEHVQRTCGCDVRFLLKKVVSSYGVSESVILTGTSLDTASSFI